ncbi:MAG: hypothetical protein K8T89_26535, partial [Planctomycetes bacterium]|nr:hypothetical protein [Planctomycetota bacterium]
SANRAIADKIRNGTGYSPIPAMAIRRYSDMKASGWKDPPRQAMDRYRLGSHIAYLHRILNWAKANNVTCILVDMPVTEDLQQTYPDAYRQYDGLLNDLERDRGVRIIRATRDQVGLDDRHFADMIHLNGDGAARFSGWLRKILEDAP